MYPRPIVVVNPIRYTAVGDEVMSELCASGREPELIHSVIDPVKMGNLILSHAQQMELDGIEQTALLVVGGDGTASDVRSGLLEARRKDTQLTELAVMLTAGGFASDGRHATQARKLTSPSKKLDNSVRKNAHWIEREMKTPEGSAVSDTASFYVGFGKTAYGSGLANDSPHLRMGSLHRKASIGIGTLRSDEKVVFKQPDGTILEAADYTFCLNSIMSGQFRMNTSLFDTHAYAVATPEGFWRGFGTALRLSTANHVGMRVTAAEFTLEKPTLTHHDGNKPVELAEGTVVHLGVSTDTYPMLVTKAA